MCISVADGNGELVWELHDVIFGDWPEQPYAIDLNVTIPQVWPHTHPI